MRWRTRRLGPKNDCRSLARFAPYLYEAHRRPPRCLADRLSVSCVIFCRFTKGLHIRWRNKHNLMTDAKKARGPNNAIDAQASILSPFHFRKICTNFEKQESPDLNGCSL